MVGGSCLFAYQQFFWQMPQVQGSQKTCCHLDVQTTVTVVVRTFWQAKISAAATIRSLVAGSDGRWWLVAGNSDEGQSQKRSNGEHEAKQQLALLPMATTTATTTTTTTITPTTTTPHPPLSWSQAIGSI